MESSISIYKTDVPEWLRGNETYEALDEDTSFLIDKKYVKSEDDINNLEDLKHFLLSTDYWGVDTESYMKKILSLIQDDYSFYSIMSFILGKGEFFCRNIRERINEHKLGPLFKVDIRYDENLHFTFTHRLYKELYTHNVYQYQLVKGPVVHDISFSLFSAILRGEFNMEELKKFCELKKNCDDHQLLNILWQKYEYLQKRVKYYADVFTIALCTIKFHDVFATLSIKYNYKDGAFSICQNSNMSGGYYFNMEDKKMVADQFDLAQRQMLDIFKNNAWHDERNRELCTQMPFPLPHDIEEKNRREEEKEKEREKEVLQREKERRRTMSYITALKG
jgi:hypothetical protein